MNGSRILRDPFLRVAGAAEALIGHGPEAGLTPQLVMKSQSRRAADSADEPPPAPANQSAENATGETAEPTATMTSGFHAAVAPRHHVESHPQGKRLAILSLTALGVVYGDI